MDAAQIASALQYCQSLHPDAAMNHFICNRAAACATRIA